MMTDSAVLSSRPSFSAAIACGDEIDFRGQVICDNLNRIVRTERYDPAAQYTGYDLDETTYAQAIDNDTILEQSEIQYDAASNVIQATARQRYHNAPASQTGPLGDPSTDPKARVTYTGQWHDALGRQTATAAYGTNGGTALVRPR